MAVVEVHYRYDTESGEVLGIYEGMDSEIAVIADRQVDDGGTDWTASRKTGEPVTFVTPAELGPWLREPARIAEEELSD
jgi:hypothetical protein